MRRQKVRVYCLQTTFRVGLALLTGVERELLTADFEQVTLCGCLLSHLCDEIPCSASPTQKNPADVHLRLHVLAIRSYLTPDACIHATTEYPTCDACVLVPSRS